MITSRPKLFNICVFYLALVFLDYRKRMKSIKNPTRLYQRKLAPNQARDVCSFIIFGRNFESLVPYRFSLNYEKNCFDCIFIWLFFVYFCNQPISTQEITMIDFFFILCLFFFSFFAVLIKKNVASNFALEWAL